MAYNQEASLTAFSDRIVLSDDTVIRYQEPVLKTVTFTDGTSTSGEVDVRGYRVAGLIMPSAWTTSALSFQNATVTGGTFINVYNDGGAEVSIASAVANTYIAIDTIASALSCLQFIKVRSGLAAAPANQTGGDVLTLVLFAL
jgi:hypothetical protein